jgi:hypothetical protein
VARYNLSTPEQQVVTTWLFEPDGYLDVAVNEAGVSARQARQASPTLDVAQWIRTNTRGTQTDERDWTSCGMAWWIRANDGVNVNPPQRPPESIAWRAILAEWDESITRGFGNVPQSNRNASTVPLYDATGAAAGTMPAGNHLAAQKSMISKVLGVI